MKKIFHGLNYPYNLDYSTRPVLNDIRKGRNWAYISHKKSNKSPVKEMTLTIRYIGGDDRTPNLLDQRVLSAALRSLQETDAYPTTLQTCEQFSKLQSNIPTEIYHRYNLLRKEVECLGQFLHSLRQKESMQKQPLNVSRNQRG